MRYSFVIISILAFHQLAISQSDNQAQAAGQGSPQLQTQNTATSADAAADQGTPAPPGQTKYIDYQSVYEASTLDEEVKMAAERFSLTPAQQEVWSVAAVDRRTAERTAKDKLSDPKLQNYEKDGLYRGMRIAQNNFHETITGYLSPVQKQALETDRLILQEKQKRLAKLPPPPPPAPTVTVAPIDSTAIKAEMKSKSKSKGKKKKKG